MEKNREKIVQIVIFVIALLIGFGVGFLVFADRGQVEDLLKNAEQEAGDLSLQNKVGDSASTLSVPAEQLPGTQVAISKVTLSTNGWLVVYNDLNGQPGSILGARYYPAGTYENITFNLQVGTTADNTYYVLLHNDDGKVVNSTYGTYEFDHTKDLALTDSTGRKIQNSFTTKSPSARGI